MNKVSLLDCIARTPQLIEAALENRKRNFAPLLAMLGDRLQTLTEIVLIGSGTSNTSAETSRFFVEKATRIKTTSVYPNDFFYNTYAYNPNALHVFTSQTGTSTVVREAQKKMCAQGFLTACVSESPDTPIARESAAFIDMGCGREEYPMRTIGYSLSVFTHMLMGLEIGLSRGSISQAEYDAYIAMAGELADSQRAVIPATLRWMDRAKRRMLRSRCLVFTGADSLQGVALEAAIKAWETPQIISMGYELEEGIHGPNYGYNHNHCVVVLNQGGREDHKALALARWMKDVYQNGLVIGSSVVDDDDLKLEHRAGDFGCLELAPAVQVLTYRLAEDQGRDLYAPHDNRVMESYFRTHSEDVAIKG